jgi:hypothetical protein
MGRRIGPSLGETPAYAAEAEIEAASENAESRQEDADEALSSSQRPFRALGARLCRARPLPRRVLYFGWNGGYVGGWLGDGLQRLIGVAAYGLPVALVVLGALMVMRSALVDVRPFRIGLAVLARG